MIVYTRTTKSNTNSITTIIILLILAFTLVNNPFNSTAHAQCYYELFPPDGSEYDSFINAAAISNNVAILGTPYDYANGSDSGSAYIYRLDPEGSEQWILEQKIISPRGEPGDLFGYSVAIAANADVVIIGACKDDDTDTDAGAAYIYKYDPDNSLWKLQNKIFAEEGSRNDFFGISVSISESGDTAIIGAHRDDYKKHASGSAYIFQYNEQQHLWKQKTRLNANDPNSYDYFGYAVSISQDAAIVGAYGDSDNGQFSGSAYIFRYHDSEDHWIIEDKITSQQGAAEDWFGSTVSISGDTAVVGARNNNNENGYNAGAAYVYRYNETSLQWHQELQLLAKDGASYDQFGFSVSISNNVVIVGTPSNEIDNNKTGSAYIFKHTGTGKQLTQDKIIAPDNDNQEIKSWFGYSVAISDIYAIISTSYVYDVGVRFGSVNIYDFTSPCSTAVDSLGP